MSLSLDPNHVWRDFETDGVPSSGAHKPRKVDIRQWSTGVWQAVIALIADADPGLTLPNLLIRYTVTGGDENDIEATPNLPAPDGAGLALFSIAIAEANTGPVTINGKPLLTNTGNQIAPGGLAAGGVYLFLDNGDNYRLLSDYASAAIIAAAEEQVLLAQAWATGTNPDGLGSLSAREWVEEFRTRYLGAFADDAAATAFAGSPIEGALFFRETDDTLRVYRSGAWTSAEGDKGDKGDPGPQGPQGERDTRNFAWAGSFDWWRKGPTISLTTGRILACDGWTVGRASSAPATVSQQQGSRGSNLCARVQRPASNSDTQSLAFVHNLGIDDSRPLTGKEVTVTLRVRGGADFSGASLSCSLISGSGLTEQVITATNGQYTTGNTTVAGAAPALTTSWQDITFTGTVSALASQVAVRVVYAPTGTAGAADYFEIEEVQVVLGSTASTFVPIDPAYSLMKAQRQFWKTYNDDVAPGAVNYNGSLRLTSIGTATATACVFSLAWPPMRAAPTVTVYSPQTGASGKMAQGSTADKDATASHIGIRGCGVANAETVTASALHYIHVTAEARL